jgi:hypothetical protein
MQGAGVSPDVFTTNSRGLDRHGQPDVLKTSRELIRLPLPLQTLIGRRSKSLR